LSTENVAILFTDMEGSTKSASPLVSDDARTMTGPVMAEDELCRLLGQHDEAIAGLERAQRALHAALFVARTDIRLARVLGAMGGEGSPRRAKRLRRVAETLVAHPSA